MSIDEVRVSYIKYTKEQFDEIGPFYVDDFPIDDTNQDLMLKLFNHLPPHLQSLAIEWGCNETQFRDDVFTALIKSQFGLSVDEYYTNELTTRIRESNECININFDLLKRVL